MMNSMIEVYTGIDFTPDFSTPDNISYYKGMTTHNPKIIRLIEEGLNSPEEVSAVLVNEVHEILIKCDEISAAWDKSWYSNETPVGTWPDEYYDLHKEYEHPQYEFPRITYVAYSSLYVLASIDRLDKETLTAWVEKEKPWRHYCQDMEVWLVDRYYRDTAPESEAAKRHMQFVAKCDVFDKRVLRSKWNASWDTNSMILNAAGVSTEELPTIEILDIPQPETIRLSDTDKDAILTNFLNNKD